MKDLKRLQTTRKEGGGAPKSSRLGDMSTRQAFMTKRDPLDSTSRRFDDDGFMIEY